MKGFPRDLALRLGTRQHIVQEPQVEGICLIDLFDVSCVHTEILALSAAAIDLCSG